MNVPFLQDTTFTGLLSTKNYGTSQDWYNTTTFIQQNSASLVGSSLWGTISGTLSAQTDLWGYLSAVGTSNFDITTLNTYLSTNSILLCSLNVNGQILSAGIPLHNIFLTAETDSQALSYNTLTELLSITNGNSVSLASLNDKNYVNTNFFPLSGGTISGATRINNNLSVFGNLTASGTTTFANTVFSVTSALSVVHIGSGPAVWVGNNGDGDIASFYDIDEGIEILHVGGNNGSFPNVGVKTSSPNKDFTVKGEISASSTIYDNIGNSTQWNQAYTTVQANSASWEESADILPTVTNYLSTNSVRISALTITNAFSGINSLSITGNISGNNLRTSFNQGSATGNYSFAVNTGIARGLGSFAAGSGVIASGTGSHAEGYSSGIGFFGIASGTGSHVEGYDCIASNIGSHAEGFGTIAFGAGSHAEGEGTEANAYVSHAEGGYTKANGDGSHAEGVYTEANGYASHAAGLAAIAQQNNTYIWSDGLSGTRTDLDKISTTRAGQYMIDASGGVYVTGKVGIGTDSTANALTVVGSLSVNSGVITENSHLNISQHWNNSAIDFNGLNVTINPSAYNTNSTPFRLTTTATGNPFFGVQSVFGYPFQQLVRVFGDQRGLVFGPRQTGAGSAPDFFSLRWQTGQVQLINTATFGWSDVPFGGTENLVIARDANDTLAQRRGTNPQAVRIYNTYTAGTPISSEYGFLQWSGNTFQIGTSATGSGSIRQIEFLRDGQRGAFIDSGFFFNADAGFLTPGQIRLGAAQALYWNGRAVFRSPAVDQITLFNSTETGFNRLNFGGTTASFPALKRSDTGLQVRLADDTDFAPLSASTITAVSGISAIGVSRFVKSNPVTDYSNIVEISRGGTFVIGFRDDGVVTANTFAVTQAGNSVMDSSGVAIQSTARFGFSNGAFAGTTDADLRRDAADTIAQRRGTNAQTFRLYNTFTTGTPISSEFAYIGWTGNTLQLGTSATGGLNARNFEIMKPEGAGASGAAGRRFFINPAGQIGIGTVTGDQTSHGIFVNPAAGQTSITHAGGSLLINSAGVIVNDNTRFISSNRSIVFGNTVNSTTPMIIPTGVGTTTPGIQVRLADNSNFVPLSAGGLAIDSTTSFPVTGDASTGFITAISGHNFLSGDRVIFFELVGGSGIGGGYFQPTPTTYFVRDLSGSRDFRISTTLNGSPFTFTTNISTGSFISNLNPTVNLRAVDSANNSWLVLQPKGNGGIIAGPRPDGTIVGGNTRGRNAVDLQMVRSAATQVCNGEYATTVGGAFNACNGRYSVVGGVSNTIMNDYNTCFGGNNFINNSTGGSILGGEFNNVSGNYSTVVGGTRGVARRQSSVVYANGRFSADGDAQQGRLVFRNKSTTNTPVELFLDGGSLRFTVPSGLTVSSLIHVAATTSGGEHVCQFLRECVVRNRAGTTELRGSVATVGTDTMEVSGCNLSIQADDANDALSILFTGYTPVTGLSALATTDQISGTNHGFQNNDDIVFTGLQSGAGITANTTTYWVTSAQPDTFYVSLTRGGTTPVNITTNYTAMTATRLMRVVGYADFVELGHGT